MAALLLLRVDVAMHVCLQGAIDKQVCMPLVMSCSGAEHGKQTIWLPVSAKFMSCVQDISQKLYTAPQLPWHSAEGASTSTMGQALPTHGHMAHNTPLYTPPHPQAHLVAERVG